MHCAAEGNCAEDIASYVAFSRTERYHHPSCGYFSIHKRMQDIDKFEEMGGDHVEVMKFLSKFGVSVETPAEVLRGGRVNLEHIMK